MKPLVLIRVLGAAFGAMGVGVLLGGGAPSANAFPTVHNGTNYIATPEGSVFTYGGIQIPVKGLPIGTPTSTPPTGGTLGKADTVVIRLDDVTTSGGITNIEVVGLSLQSEASANIPGLPWSATDSTDIFVGLQKYYTGTGTCGSANCPSPGTIKMYEDSGALKFDASFTIRDVVILAKAGSLLPTGTDYVKDLIDACSHVPSPAYLCVPDTFTIGVTGARWQSSPGKDFLLGDNLKNPGVATNFFLSDLTQLKSTSTNPTTGLPNKIHGVVPTPAPLPFLGASTAYAFARRLRKRCRQAASA